MVGFYEHCMNLCFPQEYLAHDCIMLEEHSVFARRTILCYRIPNKNEIRSSGKSVSTDRQVAFGSLVPLFLLS
jgi:hypothetical protein